MMWNQTGSDTNADIVGTNNQANDAYTKQAPDDEDAPYSNISSEVAIQTAKPKTVEEVMNLPIGKIQGNRELPYSRPVDLI